MQWRTAVLAALLMGCAPTLKPPETSLASPTVAASTAVVTEDIERFWVAHDAAVATPDVAERAALLQRLYIDPGSPGLHALMQARDYTAQSYADVITRYPRYWASVRPLTARARSAAASLEQDLATLRKLYPELRPATITYAIGAMRTGGTTLGDKVLIGAEIALTDESVDVSEFPEPMKTRLGAFFATRPIDNNGQNNVHEYVHTQQRDMADVLASRVVYEGVAEFVAEQVTGKRPPLEMYRYGPAHADAIREHFVAQMDGASLTDWLYNAPTNTFGVSDLGYYVGYEIARGYHARAADKRAALREMIQLDYGDVAAVKAFIQASGYLQQ
ncbi:hypothetical protein OWM54_10205 [Myxococcus sp. MISCRS1]|uniref:hypothetical protein n=1 Tax=unclassified Myxococcus TaxID=2648731 RepID=UPI001CC08690|nr:MULTISPECIES: hypothetical protein [unclassified Myxococcus]MBZ4401506.1 hypothetical protein [Myxococcus sp. AS-1-15]MBZ4412511.1 hypothetical protein [Myxococcus sp. XM-1-1-1]MCY0997507.1 hypothetical protein [Myxococcus sp. MISCRS1]BDT32479.1 DUF2268 domain-containing putative Zn-dependent protease [Myxococcus sp. MH1]